MVIYLGHTSKEPLMCPTSELLDGLEPHGQLRSSVQPASVDEDGCGEEGCTRGGAWLGSPGGCYTGYPAWPDSRLI